MGLRSTGANAVVSWRILRAGIRILPADRGKDTATKMTCAEDPSLEVLSVENDSGEW